MTPRCNAHGVSEKFEIQAKSKRKDITPHSPLTLCRVIAGKMERTYLCSWGPRGDGNLIRGWIGLSCPLYIASALGKTKHLTHIARTFRAAGVTIGENSVKLSVRDFQEHISECEECRHYCQTVVTYGCSTRYKKNDMTIGCLAH